MGIEREDALMEVAGTTIVSSLTDEPREDGGTIFRGHTLRMPLNTENAFILTALYRLDDAISRTGSHSEALTRIRNSLMMEGVNK